MGMSVAADLTGINQFIRNNSKKLPDSFGVVSFARASKVYLCLDFFLNILAEQ